ncbi:YbaY family lipoprotein [Vibrio sp. SCSIO 43136]|uniref:YbaY family lipoprotein n=1 Tax=Vibrio sp. SCSIO 43136 TaxID=2819101 RepID=UPI00207547E7|nr:YbaY family lipoprotein [Vibrio sp. SCSIO 43136]USD66135.1 YbaY family lipoprotein [Vibrio sp. SCSIO 43136]
MLNKSLTAFLLIMVSLLAGCQYSDSSDHNQEELAVATIVGTVSYRERIALPENAKVTVTLQDISLADAPSVEIARTEFDSFGFQSPFAYQLDYDPSKIIENHRYSVSARITVDGQLKFITDTVYSVITDGNETDEVDLKLIAIGNPQ